MVGLSEWLAYPSGWLIRVVGLSEWLAFPSGWLIRVVGLTGFTVCK